MQYTHIHEILPYTFNGMVKTSKGTILAKQYITGGKKEYKVIYNDDITIVILSDGSKGVAKRNSTDQYCKQIGHDIAYNRAEIKRLRKEIDRISRTAYIENRRVSPDYL